MAFKKSDSSEFTLPWHQAARCRDPGRLPRLLEFLQILTNDLTQTGLEGIKIVNYDGKLNDSVSGAQSVTPWQKGSNGGNP